ncbi:hypothetical protein RND81_01G127200 [Saponaria officinalis]
MSIFGNTTNPTRNPFTADTNGNASMSVFGNTSYSTRNPFAANTTGNASMSVFGHTTNSSHNPFSVSTTGNVSASVFGIPNPSTINPFAVSTADSATLSAFGNSNNSTPNRFGRQPSSLMTSPSGFRSTAGPTGTSGSPAGLTNHVGDRVFGFGGTASASVSQSTGSIFGQSSNAVFGTGSPASPFSTSNLGNSTFAGTRTSASNAGPLSFGIGTASLQSTSNSGSNRPFSFGVMQAPLTQNKGSRISPYAGTKDAENCKLLSITGMPIYESKCHEELRWEDYELKSRDSSSITGNSGSPNLFNTVSTGTSSSSFSPRTAFPSLAPSSNSTPSSTTTPSFNLFNTVSTGMSSSSFFPRASFPSLAPSSNSTPSSTTTPSFNLFNTVSTGMSSSSFFPRASFPSLAPSSNSTPSSTTTSSLNQPFCPNLFSINSAPSTNSTPSSTTTPVFTHASSPFRNSSFPNLTPSSNSIPSSTVTSLWNQPSSSFPNTFSPSPTPSNPTVSTTGTPSFNQASFQNPISNYPAPPSTSTPSSTITWPFTKPLPTSDAPDAQPPSTPWSTLSGTGNSQINPTSSTWAVHTSTGNIGGSTDKRVDCIIAVKDPFGSQRVTSHPSVPHPTCSPLIRNGISSMPVIDKPATTRISSLVTPRRISPRPLIVHARKYHPKSDEPKVPFFDHTNETQNTQKKPTSIIPRVNPRSVFGTTSKRLGDSGSEDEVTDASALLHKDGGQKVPKPPINNPSVPKLHRSDYYTHPSIQDLRSVECSNPGFCSHVKDFVVGRHGYGWVKFDGETDIRGLDLDALVYFNKLEVVVYKDENEKPEVGKGLNKGAEVTLLNVKCTDKTGKEYTSGKMVDKFMEKLKKVTENQGAEFICYDAVNGVWKFQVKHFSWYGIIHENAE